MREFITMTLINLLMYLLIEGFFKTYILKSVQRNSLIQCSGRLQQRQQGGSNDCKKFPVFTACLKKGERDFSGDSHNCRQREEEIPF